MIAARSHRAVDLWIEWLLASAVVAALIYDLWYLVEYGYLPEPFFYEPSDTWMDWFNTAFWAHQPGAYDSWGTVYPPLSFVALKFLTFGPCYTGAEGYASRDCDLYGAITLHVVYLLIIVLTAKTFIKIDRRTAVPRSVALSVGIPMLYGLERGNLILLCYLCVLLAYGPLLRSARLRWLFAGLAFNFKVYLIGPIFAQVLKRRWRWFEGALIATLLVYLVSYAIHGAGSPVEIYNNIRNFQTLYQAVDVLNLWNTTTYLPMISLLNAPTFPLTGIIGSRSVEVAAAVLPAINMAVQATLVLAAVAAWWRPGVVPMYRLVFLSIALALISSEPGGYAQILLILFVFMERSRGFGRRFAIITAYLLCIGADIPVDRVPPLQRDSFLTGQWVIAEYRVGLFAFLRPMMVLSLCVALSLVTIRDVWADARLHGWAGRRRTAGAIPTDS